MQVFLIILLNLETKFKTKKKNFKTKRKKFFNNNDNYIYLCYSKHTKNNVKII